MKCKFEKELPEYFCSECKLTGGICGKYNEGNYTFCHIIMELEEGLDSIEEMLLSPTVKKDEVRDFIKQIKKEALND